MMRGLLFCFALTLAAVVPAAAQECTGVDLRCNQMIEASQILQARAGIALAGGNPVPGATSTLGMRIGHVPRMTVGLRATGAGLNMPGVKASEDNFQSLAISTNLDAAVGLFSGFTVAPTIGGVASLDVVGSAGKLLLPGSHGLEKDPFSWALGLRAGVLRESFTAPGISATFMYRRIGEMKGNAGPVNSLPGPAFTLESNQVLSARGVIGKRILGIGASGGVGYDSYRSDVVASGMDFRPVGGGMATYAEDGRKIGRLTTFVSGTWTSLIVNLVAEAGLQRGGDVFTAQLPAGESSRTQKTGYYATLAIRLAL